MDDKIETEDAQNLVGVAMVCSVVCGKINAKLNHPSAKHETAFVNLMAVASVETIKEFYGEGSGVTDEMVQAAVLEAGRQLGHTFSDNVDKGVQA